MRYQQTNERRAVILMVVLSLLTLFALVGITFVLYADAEAASARVAREAQTMQTANVNPKEALAFFLGQLIYDVPDSVAGNGVGSGLRGHSLARTEYGQNYTLPFSPGLNLVPFNGPGRLHYGSPLLYPTLNPPPIPPALLNNVPQNWGTQLDDYAMVNYTWFSSDGFVRDPERFGSRTNAQLLANTQTNVYVGGNAPYTYPDLNNFFLAAMRADGTVLTPSFHRPWLFQVVNGKYYAFNDMINNPNWINPQGKYLTLRPRPKEHPGFPLPGDATGDVKNLTWAPGGNDSIWMDLGAPVMTAPDGTLYKMMFAPLVLDLDGRVNLNTSGNILAYIAAMSAAAGATNGQLAWQAASQAHVSNQGWGPWEVNLAKVLWADQLINQKTVPPTPPEWMRLFTGASYATTTAPNTQLIIPQPGVYPPNPLWPGLSAWLLPGVRGRYLETMTGNAPVWTPNAPPASIIPFFPSAVSLATTYQHAYAMGDINGMNEAANNVASSRPLMPGYPANPLTSDPAANPPINPFASFQQGFSNGNATEITNHPSLFDVFQNPFTTNLFTRTFRASDMSALLRPNASINGPVNANASSISSDLLRLCPTNFPSDAALATLPATLKSAAMRFRNLATTQSWDIGSPGVTPYWWNGMTTGWMIANNINPAPYGPNFLLAPYASQPAQGAALAFPPLPPNPATGNVPGTNPILSEYGLDWRAVSANSAEYFPTSYPTPFAPPTGTTTYITPGARIRLNRPLPPYPHMGALLTPPYNSLPPGATASPYGMAYPFNQTTPPNMTVPAIAGQYNQYLAAQTARQALANDIYRRLLAVAGLPKVVTPATPTNVELAPRRWLAQLAVNIVDYMDEDDIMTPFNFYTVADGLPAASLGLTQPLPPKVPDDPGANTQDYPYGASGANATGANPDYWVFGTELPKVVLNEALAEAQNPDPTKTPINAGKTPPNGGESVKVWLELFNTMPNPTVVNPTTLHTQPQDSYRVPLYMPNPAGTGYSPYRVTIAQYLMNRPNLPVPPPLPASVMDAGDDSENVLGKAYIGNAYSQSPLPQSTTDYDFSSNAPNTYSLNGVPLSQGGGATQAPFPVPGSGNTINAGVDPGSYFLIGPNPKNFPSTNNPYQDPFAANLPPNIPVLRTDNVTYQPTANSWPAKTQTTDYSERTSGLTVMLRRLANPYLPPQLNPGLPYYNPYVTVDLIQGVPIRSNTAAGSSTPAQGQTYQSRGKEQPFAGLTLLNPNPPYNPAPNAPIYPLNASYVLPVSPVMDQLANVNPPAPPGAIVTKNVTNTFGYTNWPPPPSGHYDWLVHLDRPPISPMELLHVSAWPPYMLTQLFMKGSDNLSNPTPPIPGGTTPPSPANALNMFGHYAPWLDAPPAGITGANLSTLSCPWWFDLNMQAQAPGGVPPPYSHRLYRLFEFLECGDRAFGVNGLGRIPGKVNINTVWDSEILQALIDANQSMGIAQNSPSTPLNPADPVFQIFSNMMLSRSPSYYTNGTYTNATTPLPSPPTPAPAGLLPAIGPVNMGTGGDDRPFMPLSTGLYLPKGAGGGLQFPNGLSVITDTLLRTNNPFARAAGSYPGGTATNNLYLLFQNYNDTAAGGTVTTSAVHPYLQTQMLTKLSNNVTTRSNVFAVFLTVGFFQVTNPLASPPTLGPEIGISEGKQIRHRMFAIVDRTNLATCATASLTAVTGVSPNATNAALNFTGLATIQLPVLTFPLTITGTATQLFVPNPTSLVPGLIQPGTQLVVDAGNINEETITVISVTPPVGTAPATITANFTLPHAAGFSIIQRGNPGPWLLTPYDPRLDPFVVPYFTIID